MGASVADRETDGFDQWLAGLPITEKARFSVMELRRLYVVYLGYQKDLANGYPGFTIPPTEPIHWADEAGVRTLPLPPVVPEVQHDVGADLPDAYSLDGDDLSEPPVWWYSDFD